MLSTSGQRRDFAYGLLALAMISSSCAQTTTLEARWIPTDLNYAMISRLSRSQLQNVTSQITGYSILGVVSVQDVGTWITTLVQNNNVRDGTVRWQPAVAGKCSQGQRGCTKSIKVTVLEFNYGNLNATDCRANALIAADAILPPFATMSDSSGGSSQTYMPPVLPITYQVTAAPNATASNCTYMITYPSATQTLANTLCFTGSNSCTNSTCVPCNANTTLTSSGSDPENNCTPQNGVAPALVAAIEGAAQCLALGGQGRFQCQVGYPANSPCTVMHCFPGDARILIEGGQERSMQALQMGDRVQVAKQDGTLGFEDVYFFGHREANQSAVFIKLTLETREGKLERRQLELSSHHFVHSRAVPSDDLYFRATRAKDVKIGHQIQISSEESLRVAEVVSIGSVRKQGLWNPYTLGGNIIVNGVAASSHSEWILDPLLDRMGLTEYLPAVYQILLAPVRLLYHVMGAQQMIRLDSQLDLGNLVLSMPSALCGSASR